jgi:hypothetical protein
VLGPSDPGVFSYTAQFDAASLAIAHSSAEAPFSVVAALPPEHTITVRVSDRFTGDPIEDVSVRCAVYRAVTNSDGVAVLRVPSGAYELCASKPSYEDIPPRTVDVTGDLVINVQSAPTHDTNPDDERMWM